MIPAAAPADVETREVADREGSHGEAEVGEHPVHVLRQGPLLDEKGGFAQVAFQHAVADEAVADARDHRHLPHPAPYAKRGDEHLVAHGVGAHHFEQAHDVGGAEEMGTEHLGGAAGGGGDAIHVEVGGVARDDRLRLADRIEAGESLELERHLLEDRLDDEIRGGDRIQLEHRSDARETLAHRRLAQAPLAHGGGVVPLDGRHRALDLLLPEVEELHRDAGVGEVHGDAAAHGPRADHRPLADIACRDVLSDAGDPGDLTLREEYVPQRRRLRRADLGVEHFVLPRDALVEGKLHRGLHALDACIGCAHAPGPALDLLARSIEDPGVVEPDLAIARFRMRPAARGPLGRERERLVDQVPLHRPVHEPDLRGLRPDDGRPAEDHPERLLRAHQARQALRAAGSGRHADLHLGLTEARVRGAYAVVAGHRELETAAEGVAMDGGDHRLRTGFASIDRIPEVGLALRPGAEALDVRARDECPPAARHHYSGNLDIASGFGQRLHDAARHSDAEGVDRGIVDEDEAPRRRAFHTSQGTSLFALLAVEGIPLRRE